MFKPMAIPSVNVHIYYLGNFHLRGDVLLKTKHTSNRYTPLILHFVSPIIQLQSLVSIVFYYVFISKLSSKDCLPYDYATANF